MVILDGTVLATNQKTITFFSNVTNNGLIKASNGGVIEASGLTNFSGGTLTGGTFKKSMTNSTIDFFNSIDNQQRQHPSQRPLIPFRRIEQPDVQRRAASA